MGLPAEEAHPPKRRSIPVANSQVLGDRFEQTFSKHFPELMTTVGKEIAGINEILKRDEEYEIIEDVPVPQAHVGTLTDPETEELVASTVGRVEVQVAIDSGSVDNVVNPDDLPIDVVPPGNDDDTHVVGANGSTIKKYGRVATLLQNGKYKFGCGWQVADVTRPLHSVSVTTGPEEGPGLQDVLFNNRMCYVVPPGGVGEIMKRVRPVAEYGRRGGLYVASRAMSSFPRQGQSP